MRFNSTYAFVLLFIFLMIFVLSCTNITKKKHLYVFIVALLMGVIGAFFNPIKAYHNGDYTDLYRFYQTLDAIKGLPINNTVPIFQEYNNIPVMKILLFVISRIGINNLLPFISAFVFYGVFGLFLIKITKEYEVSPKIMALSFFVFICLFNFKMVISNIRCPLASAIFMLTLYYDILHKNKKSKCYILGYIVCCCIHPFFILLTFLKILIQFTNRYTDKIVFPLMLVYSVFISGFLELINNYTNNEIFNYISLKLDFYVNVWEAKINEPMLVLTGILQIFLLLYLLHIAKNSILKKSKEELFFRLTIAYTILAISSIWNFVIFQRTTWLLVLFIIFWFVYIKSIRTKNEKKGIAICDIILTMFVLFSMASYFLTYQYNVLTF